MASRALGAILAVLAALTLAAALASPVITRDLPAWWDGHPNVDGKTFERMDVHVGLLGAERCFDGGANCTSLEPSATFQAIGYGEVGATGLAALCSLLLAVSVWRVGDRRKTV